MVISGVWDLPAGESYMAQMLRDAGGDYPWSTTKGSGSLKLDFNQVLDKAQDADIWLIKYNQSTPLTLAQIKSDYPSFAHFRAFQTGRVYGCNQETSRFYEETPYHPDRLLSNLVEIIHPELGIKAEKHYFCRIEE